MAEARADVIIIGGGIVGTACARACAKKGLRVTVIESSMLGGGATAAGMGHIVVMDDSEAQFALCRYSQKLWNELAEILPADCEVDPCGTLWVAEDDEEMREVERKHGYFAERGVSTEILDGKGVSGWEPNLREGLAGGLRVPGDSVIYPPCAARWLMKEAESNKAFLRLGAQVVELGSRQVRLSDDTTMSAGCIVLASGARATNLLPDLPIKPKKGHLIITDRYPGFVRHQILELGYLKSAHGGQSESVAFNVQPRKTGQLLLGSSRQLNDDSRDVDHGLLERMISRTLMYMPGLVQLAAVRTWTGVRAATPDSLPLIGPHPSREGLYLATGHEGLGITTSLATGELIADQLVGQSPAIAAEPYLPARFAEVFAHG